MFKETTVAFSGHNIKWFAVLATESFLKFYPQMRENVVYFDDDSTDGTREELEKRGIKVITWSDEIRSGFQKLLDERFFDDFTQTVSSRVCFIMTDIMKQVNTKYLLMNDGDVVFKKGGFLEGYFEKFKEGNKIVGHKEFPLFDKYELDNLKDKKRFEYYTRFVIQSPEVPSKLASPRVHLLHTMIDLDYFKEINILGDDLTPENIEMMYGGIVDTGTDFYHKVVDNNIPAYWIPTEYVYKILLHWGWLSSANRDSDYLNANSVRNHIQEMEDILYKHGIQKLARELGIHPMKLIQSFKKTRGKSIWS